MSLIPIKIENLNISNDALGLSQPGVKLVEAVSKGMDYLWLPRQIRRIADAEAYAQIKLAKAEAEKNKIIALSNLELSQIQEQVFKHLTYQETQRQERIDAILNQAYQEIKDLKDNVSKLEVKDEWIIKFLNFAQDICDQRAQKLWGKVLADEIIEPDSFTLKTLTILASMSEDEAELFQKACSLIFDNGCLIICESDLVRIGLGYKELLKLSEVGLILFNPVGSFNSNFPIEKEKYVPLKNNGVILGIRHF